MVLPCIFRDSTSRAGTILWRVSNNCRFSLDLHRPIRDMWGLVDIFQNSWLDNRWVGIDVNFLFSKNNMYKVHTYKKEHLHIRKERYKFCIREDTYKGRGLHVQTIVFVSYSLACTCMWTCKYTIHKHTHTQTSTRWEIERGGWQTPHSVKCCPAYLQADKLFITTFAISLGIGDTAFELHWGGADC